MRHTRKFSKTKTRKTKDLRKIKRKKSIRHRKQRGGGPADWFKRSWWTLRNAKKAAEKVLKEVHECKEIFLITLFAVKNSRRVASTY